MENQRDALQKEYQIRFCGAEEYRDRVWKTLCNSYFSTLVSPKHISLIWDVAGVSSSTTSMQQKNMRWI